MDPLSHIGATSRTVLNVERDGKPAKAVVAARDYPTTPSDLWDAITTAERIPRWFMPIEGELKLGGRYQLIGNAGGQVTRCDAPKHLSLTWEFGGEVSWVDVVLTPASNGTHLELTHVAHVAPDRWAQYGPGAVGVGWDSGLMGLDQHFAKKASVTPAEAMTWMASDEGKTFMRQSSEAWRVASIASGTPEDEANPAAARTTAAYTGEA